MRRHYLEELKTMFINMLFCIGSGAWLILIGLLMPIVHFFFPSIFKNFISVDPKKGKIDIGEKKEENNEIH